MKKSIEIERLSSFTLLKISIIIGLFPWILIDTAIVLFHLLSGDFIVNYQRGSGEDAVAEQIPLLKYALPSYPLIIFFGTFFIVLTWVPCALSMWL